MLAAGAASPAGRLRYKIRTYGLNISSSSHLIVANLTLLGQTFHAQGAVPKLLLESLQLRYPSFSRRSLGDYRVAAATVLSCAASPAPPPAPAAGNWSACVQAMGADGCGAYREKNAKHCEGCARRIAPQRDNVCFPQFAANVTAWCESGPDSARSTAAGKSCTANESGYTVYNVSWFGSDGPTLQYSGTGTRFENCLFEQVDYSGHDMDTTRGLGTAMIIASGGADDVFKRNTMRYVGCSVVYFAGVRSLSELNHCDHQADLSNDGSCIQIRSSSANNSVARRNWATASAKMAVRLDSGSNTAFCPGEVNNTIEGNVALLSHGFELKNDYNTYVGNLALRPFDGDTTGACCTERQPHRACTSHGAHSATLFRVDFGRFASENSHSLLAANVADSWSNGSLSGGVRDKSRQNVFDAKVGEQLRDALNHDFRPVAGSAVDKAGAGPYPRAAAHAESTSSTAAGGCASYWIPGRREWRATTPVPPTGSATARPDDLDLMFLGALTGRAGGGDAAAGAQRHRVHFGAAAAALKPLGNVLEGGCNVQAVSAPGAGAAARSALPANSTWFWRVDAVDAQGAVQAVGEVWTFTVRS